MSGSLGAVRLPQITIPKMENQKNSKDWKERATLPMRGVNKAIAQMLQDSIATAKEDMAARALAEARLDADRLLLAVQNALAADGDLLDDAERQRINTYIGLLQTARSSEDTIAIEGATCDLADVTETFAGKRMNRSVQQALAGKSIASL